MTKDLTKGTPMHLLLSFGIPVLFGNLFQQLYSVVDTAIVGKILGGSALAAVGSTGSINFLVVGFCCGVCGGFAIPAAQQFGANNYFELRRYVTNGAWLCGFISVVFTAVTVFFCGDILTAINTPADIYQRSYAYICTIFAGISAYVLFNYCAGILRSLGDSRTPVIWLIAASLTNIVLDAVFILYLQMDVFGAAFATVLSQSMAGVGCLLRLLRGYPILKMEKADWEWDCKRMGHLCMMGLPMGLQYSITAIGSVTLQTAVNTLGTSYVTAATAASKVSMFMTCPFDAMGSTMATYGGQNVGAAKWNRLHEGVRSCTLLAAVYSGIAFILMLFLADPLAMLFLDEGSASLLPLTRQYLVINVAFFFPLSLVNIIRFLIQGMGFSPLATFAGVLEMAARAVLALLVPVFGFTAACFASPAAWVMADLFLLPAYFCCYRRLTQPNAGRRKLIAAIR